MCFLLDTDTGALFPTVVVDPNGTVVVLWLDNGNIMQAVRPAGQASFNTPTALQSGGEGGTFSGAWPMPNVAQNAAGKAVAVFWNGTSQEWMVATRMPGDGGFSAPTTLPDQQPQSENGGFIPTPPSAVAVAQDGNAAVATTNAVGQNCPTGDQNYSLYSELAVFTLGAKATSWSKLASYGGVTSDSVGYPVLAGGPGSDIQAAWWRDPGTSSEMCNAPGTRGISLLAGALTDPQVIGTYPLPDPEGFPANFTGSPYAAAQGAPIAMTLDSCGHGVLDFGWHPNWYGSNNQPTDEDGIYVSTLGSGVCAKATAPRNRKLPAITGTAKVGKTVTCSRGTWSGTAPLSYANGWLRDGKAIAGAHSASFRIPKTDGGQRLACRVTARNQAGAASAVSPAVTVAKG